MSKILQLTESQVISLTNLGNANFDGMTLEETQEQLTQASRMARSIICLAPFTDPEIIDEFEELKIENNTQQRLLAERSELIQQQQATIAVLTVAATGNASRQPSTPRHPDPEKFDGSRDKLRGFLGQLRLKISDPRCYPDVQDQLRYAASRLEGAALDQILPYLVENQVNLVDFASFVRILTNAFDDPDRAGTAQRALRSLKQGNRDFSAYFAEFQRHAPETGYDDTAKRVALRDGLSRELQTCLLPIAEPENLSEFVELCQRIDQKIRRMSFQNRSQSSTQQARNVNTGSPSSRPINQLSTATGTHAGPMDLSALRPKLSPEEKSRRLREGRCLYCGELGHMARECPVKVNRVVKAAAVASNPWVKNETVSPVEQSDLSGNAGSQA